MLDALGNLESFQFVMAFGSTVLHIKSAIHKKSKISLSVIRFARRSVKMSKAHRKYAFHLRCKQAFS